MPKAREMRAEAPPESDELFDADVPAAVLCAHCGDADCPGCFQEQTKSGVVAVVAWERPGASALARLWLTARATTFSAEPFFASLPDGPVAPAFRFAVASEIVASLAMTLALAVPVAVVAPSWMKHVLIDEFPTTARLLGACILGLAALLVLAHMAYGWALDLGARRAGSRGATTRALRFGLYSAGWDLVVGPVGIAVLLVKEGRRMALEGLGVGTYMRLPGVGLPGRCARAFLRGCYGLEGAAARPAMRASYIAAAAATAVGAVAVIAAILLMILS